MKFLICAICIVACASTSFGQVTHLKIGTSKTINLVFPFAIKHVDRGTKDVLVQPVSEARNILLVKAAFENFDETNLSVITDDGSVYSFLVSYGIPECWIYYIPDQKKESVSEQAQRLLDNPRTIKGIGDSKWEMKARICGIYISEGVIYYQLQVVNRSPIDYDMDFMRFYIRDKGKAKRTAVQENEINAEYIDGKPDRVKAHSEKNMVIAFQKFTIPDAKYFAIEIGEKNGGRRLLLKVSNRKILKAKLL